MDKIPYELWKDRKHIGYFKVSRCKCFILNSKDSLRKVDLISNVGIFLGYSTTSKTYRAFKKRTLLVEESMYVIFDKSNAFSKEKSIEDDDDVDLEENLNNLKLKD